MRRILETLYAGWCLFWFSFFFLLVFPAFFIIIQQKSWHRFTWHINRVWAIFVYRFCFLPMTVEYRATYDSSRPHIFCPNHTSYLDIPIVGYSAPHHVVFVGKSSLNQIPLFGYMFKNLHIPVNRAKKTDSYRSFEKARDAVDLGDSLLIFPEGGINEHNVPDLKAFKDGAFRIAIEKQVPIVPVTIPYNWIVLHDISYRMKWHPCRIIYHEPIETTGMTLQDLDRLKNQVKQVIRQEMQQYFPEQIKAV